VSSKSQGNVTTEAALESGASQVLFPLDLDHGSWVFAGVDGANGGPPWRLPEASEFNVWDLGTLLFVFVCVTVTERV
jgi:hypothetical protein